MIFPKLAAAGQTASVLRAAWPRSTMGSMIAGKKSFAASVAHVRFFSPASCAWSESLSKGASSSSSFLTLHNLKASAGSDTRRKQVGRGHASGRGKRSGRGQKGFKAHSRKASPRVDFEGGQSTLIERFPMLGNRVRRSTPEMELSPMNLGVLQELLDSGKLDATKPITIKDLVNVDSLKVKEGVFLSAKGLQNFTATNIKIEVSKASKAAIEAIESQGGSVVARYHSTETIKYFKNPLDYAVPPVDTPPLNRNLVALYLDPERRGYLSSGSSYEDRYRNYISAWEKIYGVESTKTA